MENEIYDLYKAYDFENLKKYVQNLNVEKMRSELSNICLKENGSSTLQILFKGLSNSENCHKKRLEIYSEVLNSIQAKKISARLANNLVNVLALEVDNIKTSHLVLLINKCLDVIQSTLDDEEFCWWKNLMPQLLVTVGEKSSVEQNGTVISGNEFKNAIFTTLLMGHWRGNKLNNVISVFSDMPLSSEEHLKVVNKFCQSFSTLQLNEVPKAVTQLLQLTKEQNAMPVLLTLAEYFDSNLYSQLVCSNENSQVTLESHSLSKEVRIVEGKVLNYIYEAASGSSHKSLKDFLKVLRNCVHKPKFILRPFFLTLLLNLSGISHEFQTKVMELLILTILRSIVDNNKIFSSAWLKCILPIEFNVEKVFEKITQHSCKDRDAILKGLVSLGFSLLEVKPKGKEHECEQAWKIGSNLLLTLVNLYPHITNKVIQDLINQIVQVHDSPQFTDCFAKIIRKRPINTIDSTAMIMQLLGNICGHLSPVVGRRVLVASLPIIKMSASFRDNLIIFLRKALFSDLLSRETAVYGFLELLKELRINSMTSLSQSLSQNYIVISQAYSGTYATISNEGLCLEILTILKQVYEYHFKVKIVFYKGIFYSFLSNPKLGTYILDILKVHLAKFLQETTEASPFNFNEIVVSSESSIIINEPIAHLIMAISMIISKIDEDCMSKRKIFETLDDISDKMSKLDIYSFGFDKEIPDNFIHDSLENQIKQEKIYQVLSVYEALMGFILCNWNKETWEPSQKLSEIFKSYSKLSDYAKFFRKIPKKKGETIKNNKSPKKRNKSTKQEKEKAQNFNCMPTVLNFKCVGRLIAILNGTPANWFTNRNSESLRTMKELHRYAYNVMLELMSEIQDDSYDEIIRKKNMLQHIFFIGRVLYQQCISHLAKIKEFDIQCAVLAIECFYELLSFGFNRCSSTIKEFFLEIGLPDQNLDVQIKTVFDFIVEFLINLLNEAEEEEKDEMKEDMYKKKMCLYIISIISLLNTRLHYESLVCEEFMNKLKYICKEKKIQNSAVAKALLSLFLGVNGKNKANDKLILNITLCLCDSMALIDDEMESDEHEKFSCINPRTVNSCLSAICDFVHIAMQEIDWILLRCKTDLMVLGYLSEESIETKSQRLIEKEKEICRRLNFSIKILSIICTIAVPPGHLADGVLKEVANLYNKLTTTTKYFLFKFTKYQQSFLSSRFEKTVKIADNELTKNMYCFTEHIISDGSASEDHPPLKKSKIDATSLKNKVLKETKIIPKVIYEKEQFHSFILKLSKKTKISLELKSTMARDYRLYSKQVKEIIEKEKEYMDDLSLNNDEDENEIKYESEDENDATKKAKLNEENEVSSSDSE